MKNKNGFTLVELLAVVVVLSLIVTVAVPSTISVSKKIKEKMYCSKIDFIENAAKLYGEDRRDSFTNISVDGVTSLGEKLKVVKLVSTNYLKKDKSSAPYIEDPRNKKDANGLDDYEITIYIKNERIYVKLWPEAINTCEK